MRKLYKLQVALAIDDERRQAVIDKARKYYSEVGGTWEVDDDGTERLLSAKEAIESIDDALMELMQANPAIDGEIIELTEMTCDAEESARELIEKSDELAQVEASGRIGDLEIETVAQADAGADDLDENQADVYLCRWPNGEFSVVTAPTKRQAIIALDEWGGAHPSQLHPIDSFMADFRLTDEGEIVLNEFSEETNDVIWDQCYQGLKDVLHSEDVTDLGGDFKPGGRERVLQAVKHERTRLWENQPQDEPATELGRKLARQLGSSAIVADHYVEETAKRILESDEGRDGKPN